MKYIAVLLFTTLSLGLFAQEKPKSPPKSTSATIDGVDVEINYNAPSVRDREIWGALVPYDQVWRTGANEATSISFSKDVSIDGNKLSAGTYALFTIPGKDEWTIIFNTDVKQWGAYKYDRANDALRVVVDSHEHDMVEQMEIVTKDDKVMIHWEKVGVHFSVKAQ